MNMRDFSAVRRIVVKIGTNCLTGPDGIDEAFIHEIASQIARLKECGYSPLIVTSGAIGMGARELGITGKVKKIRLRQALAAIGQPVLMYTYREAFLAHRIPVAQVLLTREVFDNRKTYLNLRQAVETLLELGAIPIFNENDSVSTAEIGTAFGDNDTLSAHIASKIDAQLLVILTDIDGLYTADPREDPSATLIPQVEEITPRILALAGDAGTTHATGGMRTKLRAAQIAGEAGCMVVIAHGRKERILERILAGEEEGTLFLPQAKRSQRERWILQARPKGNIVVDEGAYRALLSRKSLLPSGIREVEGHFDAGEVVTVNRTIKAIAALSSEEILLVRGRHSSQVKEILGDESPDVVIRADDVVIPSKNE